MEPGELGELMQVKLLAPFLRIGVEPGKLRVLMQEKELLFPKEKSLFSFQG